MLKKIDRLTERTNGVANAVWRDDTYPCYKLDFCPEGPCTSPNICDYAIRIERLAQYEDTRLTPEDIVKLQAKVKRLEKKIKDLKAKNT